jgi:secondary thiamine-phosphate synthase enzyme
VLMSKIHEIEIRTEQRNQLIDITQRIQERINKSGISDGIAYLFAPHTTAAVTINENYDPTVQTDILGYLEKLIPQNAAFRHSEGNSDAHIKSSIVGNHLMVFISDSQLVLGTWQGIYFCEFDGPRTRKLLIKIIPG